MNEDLETRKKIIETAQRLAMADGFYNLSVRNIVDAVDIPEETFYKFFKNVDELQIELATTRFGLTDENVLSLPIEEKIKKFTSVIIMQVETATTEDFRNWVYTNHLDINQRENVLIFSDKKILKNFLLASIKNGELISDVPIDDLVEFIVSLVYGLLLNWSMTDGDFEPLEHLDAINNLIINSLIPYLIK